MYLFTAEIQKISIFTNGNNVAHLLTNTLPSASSRNRSFIVLPGEKNQYYTNTAQYYQIWSNTSKYSCVDALIYQERIFYTEDTTPRVSKPKQSTDGMDLSKMFHLVHYVARFHLPTGQTEEMVAAAADDACLHP